MEIPAAVSSPLDSKSDRSIRMRACFCMLAEKTLSGFSVPILSLATRDRGPGWVVQINALLVVCSNPNCSSGFSVPEKWAADSILKGDMLSHFLRELSFGVHIYRRNAGQFCTISPIPNSNFKPNLKRQLLWRNRSFPQTDRQRQATWQIQRRRWWSAASGDDPARRRRGTQHTLPSLAHVQQCVIARISLSQWEATTYRVLTILAVSLARGMRVSANPHPQNQQQQSQQHTCGSSRLRLPRRRGR